MDTAVSPCYRYEAKQDRPMPESYPESPKTIGEHIRKKRIEMKLLQREVAAIIKVDEASIHNWEVNRTEPQMRYYPLIREFLGYFPMEFDTSTFSGKLMAYRYENGLSQKDFGELLGVDPATISDWETDNIKRPQSKLMREKLSTILNSDIDYGIRYNKLRPIPYLENPVTLGDHILKKRMQVLRVRADVAKELNVRTETLSTWESNTRGINMLHFPRIIAFLGYFPFEFDRSSFSGKIKEYRYRNGLTKKDMSKMFKVSTTTISRWESGELTPHSAILKRLEKLIESVP